MTPSVRFRTLTRALLAALLTLTMSSLARALDVPDAPLLKTDQGLTYRAWLPGGFEDSRRNVPLIIFSHGFGGCAQQSNSLMKALANAGYAVLAPNHKDEGCDKYFGNMALAFGAGNRRPERPFTEPQNWNDATEAGRRDDMTALLNYALTTTPYKDAIDTSKIGALGHSLGGYTVLGMAGAWNTWRDPRIKCVAALSPYAAPFVVAGSLAGINVPVMYQTGTDDFGIAPALLQYGGYDQTTGRKYMVVLKDAGHFAWTELNPRFQQTIAQYTVAFFDQELGRKASPLLKQKASGQVAEYRRSHQR